MGPGAQNHSHRPRNDRHGVTPVTEVVRQGETTVIRLAGELDMATVPLVRETLERERDRRPLRLTLDLADVEFLDSSAMSLLASMHRGLCAEGCELVLANPSEVIARTMQIAQIDRLLTITNESRGPEPAESGNDEELRARWSAPHREATNR